jgi:hypothetical protein
VAVVLGWGFGEVDGVAEHFEGADGRVFHFDDAAASEVVFVVEDVGQGVDGAAGDANGR